MQYEGDVADLGLDFTVEDETFGRRTVQELRSGGADVPVTNENKLQYAHLMADWHLNTRLKGPAAAFAEGLAQVLAHNFPSNSGDYNYSPKSAYYRPGTVGMTVRGQVWTGQNGHLSSMMSIAVARAGGLHPACASFDRQTLDTLLFCWTSMNTKAPFFQGSIHCHPVSSCHDPGCLWPGQSFMPANSPDVSVWQLTD